MASDLVEQIKIIMQVADDDELKDIFKHVMERAVETGVTLQFNAPRGSSSHTKSMDAEIPDHFDFGNLRVFVGVDR